MGRSLSGHCDACGADVGELCAPNCPDRARDVGSMSIAAVGPEHCNAESAGRCTECGAGQGDFHKLTCPAFPRQPGVFTHLEWERLLAETFEEIRKLSALKGGEYSGDVDRLLNFRRNGVNLGLPKETVWAVYAGKHWDAIMQFIRDAREGKERKRLEAIGGRVDDLLVYLLLFKAMLIEAERDG
jgi:hypothetical protein